MPRSRSLLITIQLLVVLAGAAASHAGTDGEIRDIPRISGDVRIDAVLDEPAWDEAVRVDLPWEIMPRQNTPAPVRTECFLMYDSEAFYFACMAHDPEPEKIRAHLTDRDTAFSDDVIGLMLDTFNDGRRAFELLLNPLGVQMDLLRNEAGGGQTEDASWDAIWDSAGRITAEGWVVEAGVPFTSLRFQTSNAPQVWGITILRIWPRGRRAQIAGYRIDYDRDCVLCQSPRFRGFEGVEPGRNLELDPTVTARRTDRRSDFPAGPLQAGDIETDLGLTALWGVTPNMTLAAAVNPDFSQVEADAAQLDVNERFALFYPEKRPFFTEGGDYFDTPFDAVYTRTVVDPSWGLKTTGKSGRNAFGSFVARDASPALLIPGNQSSTLTRLDGETDDAVLRWRRDVGESSSLGVLYTGRTGDDYSNHAAGVDGLLYLSPSDTLAVQALYSTTEYPADIASEHEQPRELDGLAWQALYHHSTREWYWEVEYADIGADFRADLGFMPKVDYRVLNLGGQRTWYGNGDQWYTSTYLGASWRREDDHDGELLLEEGSVWGGFDGPWQSSLVVEVSDGGQGYAGERFDQTSVSVNASASPSGTVDLSLSAVVGDDVDFANVRPAKTTLLGASVDLRPGRHLQLSLDHTYQGLDVAPGRLFTAHLSELRAVYQFNVRTFVRAIFQHLDLERDPGLYDGDIDAEQRSLFAQLLFSYKLNPQTVLFLGYSENSLGTRSIDLTRENRTVFLKIGYAWVL